MLETVLQEREAGHVILPYNISLLLRVALLQIVVERIKCIFTINLGKREYVVFNAQREKLVRYLGPVLATLFQNFLGFKASPSILRVFWVCMCV